MAHKETADTGALATQGYGLNKSYDDILRRKILESAAKDIPLSETVIENPDLRAKQFRESRQRLVEANKQYNDFYVPQGYPERELNIKIGNKNNSFYDAYYPSGSDYIGYRYGHTAGDGAVERLSDTSQAPTPRDPVALKIKNLWKQLWGDK